MEAKTKIPLSAAATMTAQRRNDSAEFFMTDQAMGTDGAIPNSGRPTGPPLPTALLTYPEAPGLGLAWHQ